MTRSSAKKLDMGTSVPLQNRQTALAQRISEVNSSHYYCTTSNSRRDVPSSQNVTQCSSKWRRKTGELTITTIFTCTCTTTLQSITNCWLQLFWLCDNTELIQEMSTKRLFFICGCDPIMFVWNRPSEWQNVESVLVVVSFLGRPVVSDLGTPKCGRLPVMPLNLYLQVENR